LIRALGCEGIDTYLLDTDKRNISRYSKYCKHFKLVSKAIYDSSESFLAFFDDLKRELKLENCVVFATDDLNISFLSKNKKKLENNFIIPVPGWEIVEKFYNKKSTYKVAQNLDIPIPISYFPSDESDLKEVNYLFDYPLIIKPAIMHNFYLKTKSKVFKAGSFEELKDFYNRASSLIDKSDIIIQEIIPGGPSNLYSFGSFFKNGKARGYIMGRRSRQIPMDFGKASTFVESCDIPEIMDLSTKLLKEVNYYGLSEVEFKFDQRNQEFKLLEVNPRTWKWHSIAFSAGINLPYMLYCDLLDKEFSNSSDAIPDGLKWIDLYTDLYVSIQEIAKGQLSFSDYFGSIRGRKTFSVLSQEDILPFIMESLYLPYLFKKR
jgi:D-aspartate ligase